MKQTNKQYLPTGALSRIKLVVHFYLYFTYSKYIQKHMIHHEDTYESSNTDV